MKRQTRTPEEMACGLECIRTNAERVCVKPEKGQCPRCEQLVGETLECIQRLKTDNAEKNKRIAELEAQLADAKLNHQYTIDVAKKQKEQIGKLKRLVDRMSKELAAISAERDALYRDLSTRADSCDVCKHGFFCKNDCVGLFDVDGCSFEWRGVCPNNTEVQDG